MTAVSNSRRWAVMNVYVSRTCFDCHRFPMGFPSCSYDHPTVSVKSWEVHSLKSRSSQFYTSELPTPPLQGNSSIRELAARLLLYSSHLLRSNTSIQRAIREFRQRNESRKWQAMITPLLRVMSHSDSLTYCGQWLTLHKRHGSFF